MKAGWKTKPLGEVCSFLNRGISPKYLDDGGICVLNQKCVRDHRVSFDLSRRHDARAKKVGSERYIQAGDVLVNSTGTGTLGRVAQLREDPPEPTTVDSHLTIVRPEQGRFYREFFGYMLVLVEDAIKDAGEGCGGQTELARSVLAEKFLVQYPESVHEQQRIVRILDEAFDCIATAKANAEKNLQNARALFENHLESVFSQHGEDWVETTIGEHIHFIDYRGKTPKKTASGLRLITAKNVKMGYLQENPTEFIAPASYDAWMTRGIPRLGDVLFTTEAPLANVAQLDTDEKVAFAQRIIIMQPDKGKLDSTFLKYLLLSGPVQQRIRAKGTGATVQGIKASLLRLIEISFPAELSVQRRLVTKLDALAEETQRLESIYHQKLVALEELKKSVLEKAFSGELGAQLPASVVPSFPATIAGINTTDLHAGLIAIAHQLHEQKKRQDVFGHVKAEKIAHMMEAHLGVDLGRAPVKDAAGPDDYPHLKRVEHRSDKAGFFTFQRSERTGYKIIRGRNFDVLVRRTRLALGARNQDVDRLVELMLPMDTEQAEIFSTVYAAWNNLLLDRRLATEEDVVFEARENWHPDKLKIPREKFFRAITWMKEKGVIPEGKGRRVSSKAEKKKQ